MICINPLHTEGQAVEQSRMHPIQSLHSIIEVIKIEYLEASFMKLPPPQAHCVFGLSCSGWRMCSCLPVFPSLVFIYILRLLSRAPEHRRCWLFLSLSMILWQFFSYVIKTFLSPAGPLDGPLVDSNKHVQEEVCIPKRDFASAEKNMGYGKRPLLW